MHKDLHQRSIAQMLDAIYHQYRRYLPQLLVVTLLFELPQLILGSLVQAHANLNLDWQQLANQGQSSITSLMNQLQSQALASGRTLFAALSFISAMLSLNVLNPLMLGSYYTLSHEALTSKAQAISPQATVSHIVHVARKRWGAFVSTAWLLIGLTTAAVVALSIVAVLLSLIMGFNTAIVILYLLGVLTAIWIDIRLSFTFVAVVVENARNWAAIKRSWQLTAHRFWWVLIILGINNTVLFFAHSGFYDLIMNLPGTLVHTALNWLFTLIIQPLYALVLVNLFWDLRNAFDPVNR